MKVKIAKIKITYEEKEIPHKCPGCGNRFDNENGKDNRIEFYGFTTATETGFIKKNNSLNEYDIHWVNDTNADWLHEREIITGVSCGSCGEVIIEEEAQKEYASKEELEHLKSVLGI